MAIYHLRAKVMSRSKGQSAVAGAAYRGGGHSAIHAAAYRSGGILVDERTGQSYDYSHKGHVEHTEIMAPDGAPGWVHDRSELWNRVEAGEKRKDAQLAREMEITLPRELTPEECKGLVRSFVAEQFVSRGMVADIAIHRPKASDGGEQPHAHVMLTMRSLDPEGQGFGPKVREWNNVALLEGWREAWAGAANRALEHAGKDERIDHRTLEAQGIDRVPLPNLPQFAFFDRVRELTGRIRDRFNQWVAARHTNRIHDMVSAIEQEDPASIGERIGTFLIEKARALGFDHPAPLRVSERETSFDR